ncbi:MAG TPA: hypothetical protein VLR47_06560 [Rhodospirillales bacterium]|nr:hypothetical protein [Rhodospirillales bacterium]
MMLRKPPARTFEVGLVMAGAVSAGAYTAGVIDFLLQALEAWERAKGTGADVPDHSVQIRAAAGSSAGGIISALTAMIPFTGHHPIRDLASARGAATPANADRNLLYRCWVRDIDIRMLLQTADIRGDAGVVPSLLDGTGLAAVADGAVASVRAAIASGRCQTRPAYFANPLQLYLCLTNLRGLPYVIEMVTAGGVRGHRVTCHADFAHFAVLDAGAGKAEPLPAGVHPVNWPATAGNLRPDGWGCLRDAALATSAFPGGLPARAFSNLPAFYQATPWCAPAGSLVDALSPVINLDVACAPERPYEFWCVDGGLINNEPVEFARMALAGGRDVHNARDPRQCDRAVLMIDPLPDDKERADPGMGAAPDMVDALFSMFSTLRRQARFNPQEVMLAMHEDVHSRFLVSPLREEKRGSETDLASVGLGGFAGFLHEELRMHDFQLGRRTCQKFLRDHFVVHVDNPIVAPWVERAKAEGRDLIDQHPRIRRANGCYAIDREFVPLIPLVGDASEPVALRPWPKLDPGALEPVLALIERRAAVIMPELVRGLLKRICIDDGRFVNKMLRMVASCMIREKLTQAAARAIKADLRRRALV